MKVDQKIELFLSLMAYSNGNWKVEDVITAYGFLLKETNGDVISLATRQNSNISNLH